jgi:hypothetical protein
MQGDRRRSARVDTPQPQANCGGRVMRGILVWEREGFVSNKPAADVSFWSLSDQIAGCIVAGLLVRSSYMN